MHDILTTRLLTVLLSLLVVVGCNAPENSTAPNGAPIAVASPDAGTPTTRPTATLPPTAPPKPTDPPTSTPTALPTSIPATSTPAPTNTPAPTPTPADTIRFDFTHARDIDNPALIDGGADAWDGRWTFAPGVTFHDGQFHMFYTGWDNSSVIRLGYAISDNGLDFERVAGPILDHRPDNALVGLWVPNVTVMDDGTWVLFAGEALRQSLTGRMLRATAAEPRGPWQLDDDPTHESRPTAWDKVFLPQSLARTDDGYIMLTENGWCRDNAVGALFSADGITWTSYDDPATTERGFDHGDPVFRPTDGEDDWDRRAVSSPLIFARDEGGFEMFYLGQYNNLGTQMSKFDAIWLGYATSEDGINWERYPSNPVIEIPGETGCPWMSGLKVDSTYYFYYAINAGAQGIGVLTGTVEPIP